MKNNNNMETDKLKPLRALLVEDDEDDALLIIRELKKNGYHPEYSRVETAAEMKRALTDKAWDIILCDYKLPKFSAPKAIELLKETGIDIPLIVISGTIGEETAVECMKAGALDYFMKGKLSRLAPAIERELKDAAIRSNHRQAQDALLASEDKYRTVVENAQEAIVITQDLKVVFTNRAAIDQIGYPEEMFLSRPFTDFIHPDDQKMVADNHFKRLKGEKVSPSQSFRIIRKDKDTRWVILSATVISWQDKPAVLNFLSDITEQKKVEDAIKQSEEKYRVIAQNMTDVITVMDMDLRLTFVSPSIFQLRGYTAEESIAHSPEEILTPESLKKVLQVYTEEMELEAAGGADPNRTRVLELNEYRKDGSTIWVEASFSFLRDSDGRPFGILSVTRDCDLRKKAEEKLKASEEKYRTIMESIDEGYFEVDLAGNFTFFNDSLYKILGYSREEMMGMNNRQYSDAKNAKILFQEFNEVYRTENPALGFDWRIIRKDGTERQIEASVALLKDPAGKKTGFRGTVRDVTERKRAEEALQQSEERYRTVLDEMEEGYQEVDINGKITFINEAFMKISGFSREELLGTDYSMYMEAKDVERVYRAYNQMYKTGIPIKSLEMDIFIKDGTIRNIELYASLLRDSNNRPIGCRGIIRDVTERKQNLEKASKALQATVRAMASIVETRDPYTAGHQRGVADLARAIAAEMKLAEEQIEGIHMAGTIHDIGKISVPAEILTKPGKLTEIEYSLVKIHPRAGYDVLKDIDFPWPVANAVLQHHERMDGSGYPEGLRGEAILPEARILAVADVVEAIASHRPYRPALGIEAAIEEIYKNRLILYDSNVVDACIKLFREKGYKLI